MSASDDEVGRYLERQANRRLAHAVDRAREHAEHAHIVAKLALETGGDFQAERAKQTRSLDVRPDGPLPSLTQT